MPADLSMFLHAFATEFDLQAGERARDHLLRSVGKRLASRLPMPTCNTLEEFEIESNSLLGFIGWGQGRISVTTEPRGLSIGIIGAPKVGALGRPVGYWLAACLGGLYEKWLEQCDLSASEDWEIVVRLDDNERQAEKLMFFAKKGTGKA
ncbi:cellulose biosynthesis protein BcsD [Kozakia baliensis]|uniref:Uncharacterized protein n=1 Tax=Kozakia baliensis TaxID=153496 RepID=A0A1D8UYW5_9PROT|nr:cellulose biosynthesis protein BcsD [Kozakia baliensis]AOX18752.1 hypothetical protein A0U89_15720 [Kozakia baliensis]GBR34893.1 cellulose biosynthesis protein [Kozakia baliensis NRIC 0488]GEL64978.1 hypothetical protein KBA01_22640 [Kozakia baliensis]